MSPWVSGMQVGPYVLLAPVGEGGMGEVWKARDSRLNRFVAIKRLKGAHIERFAQEARAIATLNHPHNCQVHDVGPDYLILEFVEGRQLPCPLALDEAVRVAIEIATAIEAAHKRGLIHRDLKPANIMLTADGSVKLLDFGWPNCWPHRTRSKRKPWKVKFLEQPPTWLLSRPRESR